jgi:hypothetical protein
MNRNDVRGKIMAVKVRRGLKWANVAAKVARAKSGSPPLV